MNTGKFVASAVLCAASIVALPAIAESGIYVGGGVGQAKVEDSAGNPGGMDFSESDVGLKLFAGYHLDVIPLISLAAEVGYRDLGKQATTTAGIDSDYRVTGFDYSVLAGVGLGPVDLFARVGGMQYDLQKNVLGVKNDYDGTAPLYGIGLWVTLFGLGVRAEYEKIDIDQLDNVEMVSVSAFYQF
jgi:hypothetical protein